MPYLLSTSSNYEDEKYLLWDVDKLTKKFPFLQNKVVMGELISAYIDGKVTRIRRSFKSQIFQRGDYFRAEVLEPNPLKEKGIPPCQLLVIFHKYEEEAKTVEGEVTGSKELPIMEGMLLGSGSYPYFDDEVKRIFKEEEIRITLESVIFHQSISQLAPELRQARTICLNKKIILRRKPYAERL